MTVQIVVDARARLGECPVWNVDRQQLFWVDVYNHRVHQFDLATSQDRFFDVGDAACAIALSSENRLLIALRDRLAFLNIESGEITPFYQFKFPYPNTRCNDGKSDSKGRFWIGTISEAPKQAELYRYDPDGSIRVMETELTISNGLGWSPDQSTFYLTDSIQHQIYAYDFDVEAGTIQNRRTLIDLSEEEVEPDGLSIDTEGNLWTALWNGWCIACFDASGQELKRIKLPVQRPTSLTFGGSELHDLYITTASVGLSQKEIQQQVSAGDLFRLATDSSGMPSFISSIESV
ncbi:SMP-30/gluconolaconase/LRE domain-containing protein [Leptolyngbya sp. NIES-3755]|nr:SMP-30/gluconolaconase/LRE domain-containing protein [Leptolyngbya sp. NIES-3755]